MSVSPELLPRCDLERGNLEDNTLFRSYAERFVQIAEYLRTQARNPEFQKQYKGLTPEMMIEAMEDKIVYVGLILEKIAECWVDLVSTTGGDVPGLDRDQAHQEIIGLQRVLMQQGIKPRCGDWKDELSKASRKWYGLLIKEEVDGLPVDDVADYPDLTAIVEELSRWGVLEERKGEYRLKELKGTSRHL